MAISKAEYESAGSQITLTRENSPTLEPQSIDPATAQQIYDAIVDREVDRASEVLDKLRGILPEDQAKLAAYGSTKSDEVLFSADEKPAVETHSIVDFTHGNSYLPNMDYQT